MPDPKMHADEFDMDADLVRRLLRAQFPHWAVAELEIERVPDAGTDNALYRLGDDMVARLPRREHNVVGLEKEWVWLPRLAPFLPLAVPVPLEMGEPGEGYPLPWAIYRWLEGETATAERLGDLAQVAADLAELIAALQRIDPMDGPPPGRHNSFRGGPLSLRDGSMRPALAALSSEIDTVAVTAVWEEALGAPEWDGPPVWIHGDLDARNLLVRQGRLSAVLDFGSLGVGDPATDVMVAWKALSAHTRKIFRTALAVDDATWARARGWAVSQAVIALAYYTLETNAVLVREARRWLAEVFTD